MRFLEKTHIPAPLLSALKSDAYRSSLSQHMEELPPHIRGKFDHTMSVTTLARSPRQVQLFRRHDDEIVVDPEMQVHAMVGRVVHSILEGGRTNKLITEERLGIIFPLIIEVALPGGKVMAKRVPFYVHGQGDAYDVEKQELWDYKTPKTGSLKYDKSDYIAQLNILRYIWAKNDKPVKALKNLYILLKDWNPHFVKDDDPTDEYPKTPIVVTGHTPGFPDIPMWTDDECVDYLNRRLTAHYLNEGREDDDLDHCTDEELWRSAPEHLVYKLEESGEPQKTSKFRSESEEDAKAAMAQLVANDRQKVLDKNNALKEKNRKPEADLKFAKFKIVTVPSEPRRCAHCDVRSFCGQRLAQLVAEHESQNAAVA